MPNYNGDLIQALLDFASKELTRDQAATLHNLIEANTDPTATVTTDKMIARDINPDNVERAVDLLRSKGVAESDIDKIREICGVQKPTHAMDSARREAVRKRNLASFNARFPAAANIVVNPY